MTWVVHVYFAQPSSTRGPSLWCRWVRLGVQAHQHASKHLQEPGDLEEEVSGSCMADERGKALCTCPEVIYNGC